MSTPAHRCDDDPRGGDNNPDRRRRFRANQPGTHALAVRGRDICPVESLLLAEPDVLNTTARIWEPAAGEGNIVHVLRDNGIPVIASDIEQRGFDLHFVGDFLQRERAPADCSVILTNPPYRRLAAQFAEHALGLVPDVFLLLRLGFLESAGRTELLEHSGLRRVLVFRKRRLPGPKAPSARVFAWLCWRRNYAGPTTLAWI
jgi:hypothetical protein